MTTAPLGSTCERARRFLAGLHSRDSWSLTLYDNPTRSMLDTPQRYPRAGRGWFAMLRLYGPPEPFFDKTRRPGEVEAVP
jgi:hypothetical protein